jgi:hypothetical protein
MFISMQVIHSSFCKMQQIENKKERHLSVILLQVTLCLLFHHNSYSKPSVARTYTIIYVQEHAYLLYFVLNVFGHHDSCDI